MATDLSKVYSFWDDIPENWRKSITEEYEASRPYIDRALALKEELEILRQEFRDSGIFTMVAKDYDERITLEEMGFYEAWIPSTQSC